MQLCTRGGRPQQVLSGERVKPLVLDKSRQRAPPPEAHNDLARNVMATSATPATIAAG